MKLVSRLTLILSLLLPVTTTAHDFEVDGIFYNINGNEATVTYKGTYYFSYDNEYNGVIVIPETVFHDGTIYSVTAIGNSAFGDCDGLISVTIPNSATTIGTQAFDGCTALLYANIGDAVTTIGAQAFNGCTALSRVAIGKSVTSIGTGAFHNCAALTSIDIPNSVTIISSQAFYECCGLKSVTIGMAVKTIGNDAFFSAQSQTIETITCRAMTPPAWNNQYVFRPNVYQQATLHVPIGCQQAYQLSSWGQFMTIIGDVSNDNTNGDVNGDGEVNISDANSVIDVVIMGGNAGHTRIPAADINGDGEVNIGDVNAIIKMILGQ